MSHDALSVSAKICVSFLDHVWNCCI